MVAVGTLAVYWQANIGPSLSSMSATLLADKVTYALGDGAALGVGMIVLSQTVRYREGDGVRASLLMLAGASAAVLLGDSAYGYLASRGSYYLGNPIEITYALHGGLIIAAAAVAPSNFPTKPATPGLFWRGFATVFAVASGAAVVVLAAYAPARHSSLGAVPTSLLTLLVVILSVRQVLARRDLFALARSLEARVEDVLLPWPDVNVGSGPSSKMPPTWSPSWTAPALSRGSPLRLDGSSGTACSGASSSTWSTPPTPPAPAAS